LILLQVIGQMQCLRVHELDRLPSVDVEVFLEIEKSAPMTQCRSNVKSTHLDEEGDNNGAVCKLPAGEGAQSLLCRLVAVVLYIDLADTIRLSASTRWPWNFHVENAAVLAALVTDVLEDF